MVMQGRAKSDFFPGALLDVLRGVDMRFATCSSERRDIKSTVMVPYAAGPRTSSISGLPIVEVHVVIVYQGIIGVTDHRPVHQVFRLHDGYARTHVHGCATHVV